MYKKRLQNKVAGSELTFPFCVVAATILWWWPLRSVSLQSLMGLGLCLLTTYVIMETNAQQHIIRIRTRMMSCTWLMLAASLAFMRLWGDPAIAACLLSMSYLLLFRCYDNRHPQLTIFHAFLTLGAGCFFAPAMLFMVIPFFIYTATFLRSLTQKAFWAGIIGLFVPLWCYGVWSFLTGNLDAFTTRLSHIAQLQRPSLEAITSMPLAEQVSAGVIALLSITSIIHYLRTNYDDKIRVRMMLYIYLSQTLLLMVLLAAQPAHYHTTMALLAASASPLIAHYISLSRGIGGTIVFVIFLLLTAGMAALNLWPSLLPFL